MPKNKEPQEQITEEVEETAQPVSEVPDFTASPEQAEPSESATEAAFEQPTPEVQVNIAEEPTPEGGQFTQQQGPVTVQPVKFASFEDLSKAQGEANKNLDILMDIKLQMTVELGRTELPIKKVLELTRGSIIELEKVAGEPVELYANGKLVAHGEVVVIEDNFGLRITSITDPEDRLKGI